MKFKEWILAPGLLDEASFEGNLGFEEMVKFYGVATPKELKEMEKVIKANDWEGFKNLIRKVIGVKLK